MYIHVGMVGMATTITIMTMETTTETIMAITITVGIITTMVPTIIPIITTTVAMGTGPMMQEWTPRSFLPLHSCNGISVPTARNSDI